MNKCKDEILSTYSNVVKYTKQIEYEPNSDDHKRHDTYRQMEVDLPPSVVPSAHLTFDCTKSNHQTKDFDDFQYTKWN